MELYIVIVLLKVLAGCSCANCPNNFVELDDDCYSITLGAFLSHCDARKTCFELSQSRMITSYERDKLGVFFKHRTTKVIDNLAFLHGSSDSDRMDFHIGDNVLRDRYHRLKPPPYNQLEHNCFATEVLVNRQQDCLTPTLQSFACAHVRGLYSRTNLGQFLEGNYPAGAVEIPVSERNTCDYGYEIVSNLLQCLAKCHQNTACVSFYYSKELKRCHPILYSDTPLPPTYKAQANLYQRYYRVVDYYNK